MSGKAISVSAVWFWIITAVVLVVLALTIGIVTSLIVNLPEEVSHLFIRKITIDINFFLLAGKIALGFISLVVAGYFIILKTGIIKIKNVDELLKQR